MKLIRIIFLLFSVLFSAQKEFPIVVKDSLKDVFLDDFNNLYLCKNNDFSFSKYDSLGIKIAEVRFPYPFRVQSVENPLNIFVFSENAQELKILDQNLNEIQNINLISKFGHIKALFIEDLQFAWLLDSANKSLVQYNYRDSKVINSFPLKTDISNVADFLVFNNLLYILKEKTFVVFDITFNKINEKEIVSGKKIRRENNNIYVIEKSSISVYNSNQDFYQVFSKQNNTIVEKNSNHFLALIGDKFYLYKLEK